jgi:hypothetical protein
MAVAKRKAVNTTSGERPRIKSVRAEAGGRMLDVVWADGRRTRIDFGDPIARLRVFAPLEDQAFFAKVRVINDGWAIAWSDEIDYSADALWRLAERQGQRSAA